ncbi:hypothetical protein, partial [Paenibacillus sp. CCS19]|uniref:hypothetical protein n=1 Tax=Paenibacillus sp. CCS19 TaxID=3158387 RepID=UPI00295E84C2
LRGSSEACREAQPQGGWRRRRRGWRPDRERCGRWQRGARCASAEAAQTAGAEEGGSVTASVRIILDINVRGHSITGVPSHRLYVYFTSLLVDQCCTEGF